MCVQVVEPPQNCSRPDSGGGGYNWTASKDLRFSCYNPETILFRVYPYHGNLSKVP